MTALTLYDLASEMRQIADQLAEMDIDEQTMADTLESVSLPFEQKAANVAAVSKSYEAEADAIEAAAKAMIERAKAKRNRSAWLRDYLLANMQRAGISKIECPWFKLAVRQNPESVVIDNAAQIPIDYMREIPSRYEPDKSAMKAAMQDGFAIPGAHLTRTQRVEIK